MISTMFRAVTIGILILVRAVLADRAALAESLPAGSRVQIISTQGDWTYCTLPSGARGWMPTKNIETLVPKSTT